MTPRQAETSPLQFMTYDELKWVYAYCDGEIRRCTDFGSRMDELDRRRHAVELELAGRKPEAHP